MIEATDTAASVRKLAATTTVDGTKSNPFAFSVFAKANTADVLQLSAVGAFPDPTFVNFDLKMAGSGKPRQDQPQEGYCRHQSNHSATAGIVAQLSSSRIAP